MAAWSAVAAERSSVTGMLQAARARLGFAFGEVSSGDGAEVGGYGALFGGHLADGGEA